MVSVSQLPMTDEDLAPRRPATVEAIDARLSVWGQASRQAVVRRADALCDAATAFAECHGRESGQLAIGPADTLDAVLGVTPRSLALLGATLLPEAVRTSCRILWVDPHRLSENLLSALNPHLEAARAEIRRIQALHRRRARLWRDDPDRLSQLRIDVEALSVPRGGPRVVNGVIEVFEELRARA